MPYGGLLDSELRMEFGLNDNTGLPGLPFEVFTFGLIGIGRCGLGNGEPNDGELNVGELESR